MAATVGRIQIKVTPDTKGFRQEVKAATSGIDDVEVQLDVDAAFLRSRIEAATKGLTAKIHLDVDRGSIDRLQQSISGMQMPSLPGGGLGPLTSGLGALGNPAVIIGGIGAIVAALGPMVALITAAGLAAGGLVGTMGAIAGPIALGWDGIKKAAASVAPEFENLKAVMSNAFESGLTPVFEQLKPLMAQLPQLMMPVVTGITTLAHGFADTLTSADNMKSLGTIFDNVGQAIGKAGPGLDGFVNGFIKLTESFSGGALSGLVDVFNNMGTGFSEFIGKLSESGQLTDIFGDLGGILGTIGSGLGDIVTKSIEWFNTKGPEDMMNALQNVMGFISGIISVGTALGNLPIWTLLSPGGVFQVGLGLMNQAFSAIGGILSSMWSGVTEAASAAWNGVVSIVTGVITTIGGIISSIGGTLSGAWSSLVSGAQAAWNGLVNVARTIMSQVAGALRAGIGACGAAISAVGDAIVAAGRAIIGQMEAIGRDIINGIASGIRGAAGLVKAAVDALLGLIPEWARKIMGISSPSKVMAELGGYAVDGLVKGIDDASLNAAKAAAEAGDEVGRAFADAVKDAMKDVPDEMKGTMKDAGDGTTKEASKSNEELKKLFGAAWDFGESNLSQIRGDLGIGGGAITAGFDQAATWGKTAVTNWIFNTSNVDDTIAIKNNQINKEKIRTVGRGSI